MSEVHEGGCLCGALRYAVSTAPKRTSFCTCRFCQKLTGTPMNALVAFDEAGFTLTSGETHSYTHVSEGSGKALHMQSCPVCATTVYVTLERFPGMVGVMLGTFDDPDWFERTPETARYIFTGSAMAGTVAQAHFPVYAEHVADADGTPQVPEIHDAPWRVK
ncbi:GFA family protein [Cognatishimia sp. F0-27]|uniref:GFA family protein n=1 Tax=Cognatishimia sp. F0-27 TaxID=2816855 RepID=UPI001D0C1D33|nr:GFA family protein [Cognatishimia sp. F0-27]MCC1492535.1 GFA family protein [Cognatishimia sp. F0-27]